MTKNTVTQEHIDEIFNASRITVDTRYGKTTIATCKLENGFIIVESSSCVDVSNYDEKLGTEICHERIKNKLWELEGYKLQSELAERKEHAIGRLEPVPSTDQSEPTPYISFGQAVDFMKAGKKVKRKDWGGYWFIPATWEATIFVGDIRHNFNPMIVACLKDDAGYVMATPYQADILAEDWLVVE